MQLDSMANIPVSAIRLQSYGNRKECEVISSVRAQRFGDPLRHLLPDLLIFYRMQVEQFYAHPGGYNC